MIGQDLSRTGSDAATLAIWQASGGAVEALGASEGAEMRSRLLADRAGDDGLMGGRFTTHPFSCVEDGIQAANVTKGYACIPPSGDDGL